MYGYNEDIMRKSLAHICSQFHRTRMMFCSISLLATCLAYFVSVCRHRRDVSALKSKVCKTSPRTAAAHSYEQTTKGHHLHHLKIRIAEHRAFIFIDITRPFCGDACAPVMAVGWEEVITGSVIGCCLAPTTGSMTTLNHLTLVMLSLFSVAS